MRIVLAPDGFKECMTAKAACEAMARGIQRAAQQVECVFVPMADGGEGTMQALVDATGGSIRRQTVRGPLGDPVEAAFGLLGDGGTAVMEMSSASGLHLVPPALRDPGITSSYGTGELIKACLDAGATNLIVGIGGSATNDGGAGMLQALGARLLDAAGREVGPGGGRLTAIEQIDLTALEPRLKHCRIEVACDVSNPLCGPTGATYVFGPQKGAGPEQLPALDAALAHFAQLMEAVSGISVKSLPGAGAAGGLGASMVAILGAELTSGAALIMKHNQLEAHLAEADMVWTGEGRIDEQTRFGKVILSVAQAAQRHQVPVIALAGSLGKGYESLYPLGLTAAFSICQGASSLEDALANGALNLEKTAENLARILLVSK